MDVALPYLQHVEEWKIVVCRQCRHAVWPGDVRAHFKGVQHRLASDKIKQIVEEVGILTALTRDRTAFRYPVDAIEPIDAMPVFDDGLMCTFAPDECRYICRTINNMRDHARDEHGYVQYADDTDRPKRRNDECSRRDRHRGSVSHARFFSRATTAGSFSRSSQQYPKSQKTETRKQRPEK